MAERRKKSLLYYVIIFMRDQKWTGEFFSNFSCWIVEINSSFNVFSSFDFYNFICLWIQKVEIVNLMW